MSVLSVHRWLAWWLDNPLLDVLWGEPDSYVSVTVPRREA